MCHILEYIYLSPFNNVTSSLLICPYSGCSQSPKLVFFPFPSSWIRHSASDKFMSQEGKLSIFLWLKSDHAFTKVPTISLKRGPVKGCSSGVGCLSTTHTALGSNPNAEKETRMWTFSISVASCPGLFLGALPPSPRPYLLKVSTTSQHSVPARDQVYKHELVEEGVWCRTISKMLCFWGQSCIHLKALKYRLGRFLYYAQFMYIWVTLAKLSSSSLFPKYNPKEGFSECCLWGKKLQNCFIFVLEECRVSRNPVTTEALIHC